MELITLTGDREESVSVEADPRGGFRVRVGESLYHVDRVTTGTHRASLIVDGQQFEVVTLPGGEGRYRVSGPQGESEVEVADRLTHLARVGAGGSGARRSARVTAYMPGRVVALLANEGEQLAAGQGVLVLEAMKMENEIQVEHEGVLKKLAVDVGQAVEAGDLLFELE